MFVENGYKYFLSSWSECDCHLNSDMYDTLCMLSKTYVSTAIGVVERNFMNGLVSVITIFDNKISNEKLSEIESHCLELLRNEYERSGLFTLDDKFRVRAYRRCDLEEHGYREKDIKYAFMWGNIFKKEL